MPYEHFDSPEGAAPSDGVPMGPRYSQPQAERHAPREGGEDAGPVADREVPLPGGQVATLVHAWLDGEVTAATVRTATGGNEAVDLWTKINGETELFRSRTTPLYVHRRIMESLPEDVHYRHEPWYRRSVQVNPVVLAVAAAALVGIGALLVRVAAR